MYYTSIIVITWMILLALAILVSENDRLSSSVKRTNYFTFAIIASAAFGEWLGFILNGVEGISPIFLAVAKTLDYALSPLAGGVIVSQLGPRNRWRVALYVVLLANIVFQIAALFGGWMTVIDEHNVYHHGRLYFVYIVIYLAVLVLVASQFMIYGKSFSKQNRLSLYAIMILMATSIAIQEALGNEVRIVHLSIAIGVSLLFIHNSEFAQLTQDESIARQNVQIMTDALTGVRSRFAYSKALKDLAKQSPLPDDLAAFSIDVNGLKRVNDTLGHDAGDELICGAATCIQKAFGAKAECYRTGGDEFVVLACMQPDEAEETIARLERESKSWKGQSVQEMHVAAGYALASENPDLTPEKLIAESDKAMYAAKAAWYKESGLDRRGSYLQ